jgi:hypothetical protein
VLTLLWLALVLGALAARSFAPPAGPGAVAAWLLLAPGAAALSWSTWRRGDPERTGAARLAAAATIAAAALGQATGGPASPWYPATYLGLAALALLKAPLHAVLLAGLLAAAELVAAAGAGRLPSESGRLAIHVALGLAFAVGSAAAVRAGRRPRARNRSGRPTTRSAASSRRY